MNKKSRYKFVFKQILNQNIRKDKNKFFLHVLKNKHTRYIHQLNTGCQFINLANSNNKIGWIKYTKCSPTFLTNNNIFRSALAVYSNQETAYKSLAENESLLSLSHSILRSMQQCHWTSLFFCKQLFVRYFGGQLKACRIEIGSWKLVAAWQRGKCTWSVLLFPVILVFKTFIKYPRINSFI